MKDESTEISIRSRIIGSKRPVFIVAEMPVNHGGSLNFALEIARAAKRSGADMVKLQTSTADTITLIDLTATNFVFQARML